MSQTPVTKTLAEAPARPRRFLRRILWTLLVLIVLLVILTALAPTILSMGSLRRPILSAVNERIPVAVDVEAMSLSWFGSQEVQGVSVRLPDGQKVADLKKFTLDQGLLALIRNTGHIGAVRIDGGEVWAAGLQQVAKAASAKPAEPHAPAAKGPPTLPEGIKITGLIVHSTGQGTITIASAAVTGTGDQPRKVDMTWELGLGKSTGSGTLQATVDGLGADWRGWDALGASADLKVQALPLDAAWSVASDFGVAGGLQGAGALSGQIQAALARDGAITVTTDCTGKNVWVTGDLLQGDRPALDSVHLAGKVAFNKGKIDVSGLRLESDVASAKADGSFSLAALKGESPDAGGTAWVKVDLARAAAMLPHTLQVQKGLTVQSGLVEGNLEVALAEAPGSKSRVATLKVTADVSNVKAVRDDKPLALSPIHVAAHIEKTYGAAPASNQPADTWAMLRSLNVPALTVSGPFGTVTGHGRLESVVLDASLDLTSATREIGQFVDLAAYGAEGKAALHLESTGDFDAGLHIVVKGNMESLKLDLGKDRHWQEDKADLDLAGRVTFLASKDAAPTPSGATLERLVLIGSSANVEASGKASQGEAGWTYTGTAKGNGTVAWLTTAVEMVATGAAGEKLAPNPVAAANEAAGATEWRQAFRDFLRGMRDPKTGAIPGRWEVEAVADGTEAVSRHTTLKVRLTDILVGTPIRVAEPLHIQSAALDCTAAHTTGHPWQVNFRDLEVTAKEVSVKAKGDMAISEDWRFGTVTGDLSAQASADLAWLSAAMLEVGCLPKGYSMTGSAAASIQANLGATGPRTGAFSLTAKDLRAQLGPDRLVEEDNLAAGGTIALTFDDASGAITRIGVPGWTLKVAAGNLAGDAVLDQAEGKWAYTVTASGEGDTDALARTVAGLTGAKGASGMGQWKITKGKFAADDKGLSVELAVTASAMTLDPFERTAAPLRITDLTIDGSASHKTGSPWQITANDLRISTGELGVRAKGAVSIPEDFAATGLTGNFSANTTVVLPWLSDVLHDLGYWPKDYTASGTASVQVVAATDTAGKRTATVSLTANDLKAQLPDNRHIDEANLALDAKADLGLDAKGQISTVSVGTWKLKAAAGDLSGDAVLDHSKGTWDYTVNLSGQGQVEPLVQVIAAATGAKASSITGQWKITKGKYSLGPDGQAVQIEATAANLVTETPDEKKTPIQLSDVAVSASALLKQDGSIDISPTRIQLPGLVAEVVGSARLPAKPEDRFTATGSVKSLKADLAELSNLLRPLGYLPEKATLKGTATLADTNVATDAAGVVSAGGTLEVADLDVQLPDSEFSLQEKAAKAPFKGTYEPEPKRVTVSLDGLTSSLAAGTLHGSYAWSAADPVIDVQCDITSDGERLGGVLVQRYVKDLVLAGPVRLKATITGPLHTGEWYQEIVDLNGSVALTVDRMTYRQLVVEKSLLEWRESDGQIFLGDAAGKPSQLALAGGIVRLGGRLDLRGAAPHYVIDQPLVVVEKAALTAPGIQDHLKYTGPIFGEAKIISGRLTLAVDALDLPLDKSTLDAGTGRGRYQVDDLQADMSGTIGNLMLWQTGQKRTPLQQYGPVALTLSKGVFAIQKNELDLGQNLKMRLQGKIGVTDKKVDFVAAMPMSASFLAKFGANKQIITALQNEELIVPLTGTIDKIQMDEKALDKHMAELILKAGAKSAIDRFLPGGLPGLKLP